jgi:periplasmic divalent cation tolerance protein
MPNPRPSIVRDSPPVDMVLVTAPSEHVAIDIVRQVVEERLAACGNIVRGVTSIYRWEGAIQQEAEVLIVFKTSAQRRAELAQRVQQLHPYDVPEVLAFPVGSGLEAYLDWVLASTNG